MNVGVQIFPWDGDFISFGYIPRSGFAGSYGSSIFNFLKNFLIIFHNGCTNLHFHWQCKSVPFSPHHQHLSFFKVIVSMVLISILTGVRWYLIVVLFCIFLMTSNVEYLSCTCWSFVCFPWKNLHSGDFGHFVIGLFVYLAIGLCEFKKHIPNVHFHR